MTAFCLLGFIGGAQAALAGAAWDAAKAPCFEVGAAAASKRRQGGVTALFQGWGWMCEDAVLKAERRQMLEEPLLSELGRERPTAGTARRRAGSESVAVAAAAAAAAGDLSHYLSEGGH